MADAMQKSKTSLQAAPAITGPAPAQAQADYSPATVVAANKFKRFLGRHLAGSPVPGSQGKEYLPRIHLEILPTSPLAGGEAAGRCAHNNNMVGGGGGVTAPCSPIKLYTAEGGAGAEAAEEAEHAAAARQRPGSCSKLTRIQKPGTSITGGWI